MKPKLLPRYYQDLNRWLKPNKVLLIHGPRQVGKTTLVKNFLKTTKLNYRFDSGDSTQVQTILSSTNFEKIRQYIGHYQLIVIDEAQRVPNIGLGLKIIIDQIPGIRVIATGSSSFELAGQVGEPLTGRKKTLILYPLSLLELSQLYSPWKLKQKLADWLIFGGYPEVVKSQLREEKIEILRELVDSYLLKDILMFERVKANQKLTQLLRLLAFQIGSLVSLSELGQQLGLNYKTVARYLGLLRKSFIVFPLYGFYRNLRKAISKKNKYYFYDLGVRNALIANFNSPELRNDLGQLWENFIIVERIKKQAYRQIYSNNYFWHTWDGQEIDWIEEREGKLSGYEIKWQPRKRVKPPRDWLKTYDNASWKLIAQENFLEFIR